MKISLEEFYNSYQSNGKNTIKENYSSSSKMNFYNVKTGEMIAEKCGPKDIYVQLIQQFLDEKSAHQSIEESVEELRTAFKKFSTSQFIVTERKSELSHYTKLDVQKSDKKMPPYFLYSQLSTQGFSEKISQLIQAIKSLDSNIDFQDYALEFLGTSVSNKNTKEQESMQNQEIIKLIQEGGIRQIIFTGAPGTGKTYIAKEIAAELGGADSFELVQFHPSYDYTDFVEGLRPVEIKTENETIVTFKKLDGVFKAFCRKIAEKNSSKESHSKEQEVKLYFFIIDEINRANLSKVFGELMYGFEKDKRGQKNRFKTQYANLPTYPVEDNKDVFKDGFYIPENIVIIGTMNDIDRSVDSMDFALRRRFDWLEFEVTAKSLKESLQKMNFKDYEKIAQIVYNFNEKYIHNLNNPYNLNSHYDISQGQFANIPNTLLEEEAIDILEYVWNYRVKSLIREYLRGEDGVDNYLKECEEYFIRTHISDGNDGN